MSGLCRGHQDSLLPSTQYAIYINIFVYVNVYSKISNEIVPNWSLALATSRVDTAEPVMGLDTQINRGHFFSYGGTRADLWTVRNIHNLHSIIG